MQHLHWVSACRADIPQPAGGRRPVWGLAWPNVGTRHAKVKRRPHNFVIGGTARGNLVNRRMLESPSAEITDIYRYPVKGLSPEPLPRVALASGRTLPADRRYAIENGPSGFDAATPKWMSKAYFLM